MDAVPEPYYQHPPPPSTAGHAGLAPPSAGPDAHTHHHQQGPPMYGYQIPPYGYATRPHTVSEQYGMPVYRAVNMAERRAYHNATERARRENLNNRFQDLAQALPSLATVRKPSKSVIVNHSLQFVTEVKRKLEIKDRALRDLRNRNTSLLLEMNKLKEVLAIPPSSPGEPDEDLQDQAAQEAAAAAAALKQEMLHAETAAAEAAAAAAAAAGRDACDSLSPVMENEPNGVKPEKAAAAARRGSLAVAAEKSHREDRPSLRSSPAHSLDMSALTNSFTAEHILSDGSIYPDPFEHLPVSSSSKDGGSHVSFGPRETPTPPNSTPVIQQDSGAPHSAEYPCPSQHGSPYAHHMQLQQQHQHHHSAVAAAAAAHQQMQSQQQTHPGQQHSGAADMGPYGSMPRRAYSFDASYLPGMQAAMNGLTNDPRFHHQQQQQQQHHQHQQHLHQQHHQHQQHQHSQQQQPPQQQQQQQHLQPPPQSPLE
ncbi:hypothetical protein HDU89_004392 [Geranomyces variabilis]|nr:hypothetical protein HDU89_004392 [Geranomyces variabilis]